MRCVGFIAGALGSNIASPVLRGLRTKLTDSKSDLLGQPGSKHGQVLQKHTKEQNHQEQLTASAVLSFLVRSGGE